MATFLEIANDLAKQFVSADDKYESADKIISYLNNLVYTNTNNYLSVEDKLHIIKLIGDFISGIRLFSYRDGGRVIITEKRDNDQYLQMVDYMLNQLNPKK